jgi:hypothetical protein
MADFRHVIDDVRALHNLGVIKIPTVRSAVPVVAEPGDMDLGLISKLLKYYEENKGLFAILISLRPLLEKLFRKGVPATPTSPVTVPALPSPVIVAPPKDVVIPAEGGDREIAQLIARYFWINRKNTPWKEGGGRQLLGNAQFQGILSRADPLQGGDRVTIDITPVDQYGRKFVTGDAANVLMQGIEHWVVGGVAELQLQDPEGLGFDPTPTLFVPWEKESGVTPGYQGELGYYCTYRNPKTGIEVRSNELPRLRIRPWA